MYTFKKIMIALDLSAMDQYILNYVEGLSKFIKAEKIYIINVQKSFVLDDETKLLMGIDENLPFDEYIENMLKESVKKHFPSCEDFKTEFEIVEGNTSTEILKWSKVKNTDLLILGRKKELKGEGITPQQISSKVNSSILLIPEKLTTFKMQNIFVPINFTDQTTLALEEAIDMQGKTPQTLSVNCHHFYELPLGHEKSGKSDEEFAKILDQNSSKKFIKMKKEIGIKTAEFNYTDDLLKEGNIAKELVKKAMSLNSDLIIMAAKSKTLAAQLFLGNTTKKMIQNLSNIPLLIVKDKNNVFDFWDFFSKI